MKQTYWVPVGVGLLALFSLIPHDDVCMSARLSHGLMLPRCPDGTIHQIGRVDVSGLRRGAPGEITLRAYATYTVHDSDSVQTAALPKLDSIALSLVGDHKTTPLSPEEWHRSGDGSYAKLSLPEVPDGDYKLRASFDTRAGHVDVDVDVPLYTPARIHVITDRPLYEPGNVVKFRAVVLRARDLAPIEGRPGRWVVKGPDNEVLLEEKAAAGDWGVVSGTFPLDRAAETGSWHVAWVSNDATDEVPFTVAPFTLPRFRVDAIADKPFYQPMDKPVVHGAVVYSSGAPVANAAVTISWDLAGDWPAPTEWQDKLLPKHAVTAANGRFELALPQVPQDLQGRATLTARISAVDPAGDRVAGATTVLLSETGIDASVVTELGDGLVQGFNNRMYVRVTTPDGRVLPNAKIKVRRAWQVGDRGQDTDLDEDGVGSMQLDPGAPVNIIIPAKPWRPAPRRQLVARNQVVDLIGREGASMTDQIEMDRWLGELARCAKWTESSTNVRVGLRVDAGGAIVTASGGSTPLGECATSIIRQHRFAPAADRMYAATFTFVDPDLPKLSSSVETVLDKPEGLDELVAELARSSRDCLPQTLEGALPRALTWHVAAGSKEVQLGGWVRDPKGDTTESAMACVTSRVSGKLVLADKAPADTLGLIRFTLEPTASVKQQKPQATTMLGYELLVSAAVDGNPSTKIRVTPGSVPNLRLRVTPILAKPGETITAELIRGPGFTGELPKELVMDCLKTHATAKLDTEHKAKLAIEPTVEGWCEVTAPSVRAVVYVRPQADLAVAISPRQQRYAPGQHAELDIATKIGGKGGKAAVGLIGVDDSLGQLVPLPGPDDMGRVRPAVVTSSPAFNMLDGQALALGRIRGANAAAATVLRVGAIPKPPQLDAVVEGHAETKFDPIEELTDHFYIALAELHAQTRKWETEAPAAEKMTPKTMSELWKKALDACDKRGEPVVDAYGRRLRLSILPSDLLALTDPRAVVVVGTRLPEDVENWTEWVAKEKP